MSTNEEFITVALAPGQRDAVLVQHPNKHSQLVINPGKPLKLLAGLAYHVLAQAHGKVVLGQALAAVVETVVEEVAEAAVKAIAKRPGRAARAEVQEELPFEEPTAAPAADIAFMPAATSDE